MQASHMRDAMSRTRRALPEIAIAMLLLVLPLLAFLPQTLGGRTLVPAENLYQYEPYYTYRDEAGAPNQPHNHLVSDLVLQNIQWKSFIRQQLAAGEIPLWNPHQFSGIPFFAAGQASTLYPLSILTYVLPLAAAYGWFTVVNLWLAGLFTYGYLRGIGAGRGGAALAGVVYQSAGFVLASVVFPMIIGALVWLPLILLMVEFIVSRRVIRRGYDSAIPWVVIGALAVAFNLLAGHPEMTIYTLLIAGYIAAGRLAWGWWRGRETGASLRAAGWLLAMVVLGFGLAAVQFIPLLEFVGTNWRDERNDLALVLSYAHPARDALLFALPNLYGGPHIHSYADVFTGETITALTNRAGEAIRSIDWGIKNYVEGALYVGILPLVLAIWALAERWLLRRWQDPDEPPYRTLYALLGTASLTFMFGLPTYALVYALPGINQLNSPFRWVFALTFAVAVLAGLGLDTLLRRMHQPQIARWARRTGGALLALGALVLAGLLAARLAYGAIAPLMDRIVDTMALADGAFADGRALFSFVVPQVALLGALLAASGALFLLAATAHPRRTLLVTAAALGLTALDLLLATGSFNPASDPAWLDYTPPAITYLQEQSGDYRYTTLDDPAQRPLLPANAGMRYGLDDVRGYDSIIPKPYVDHMRGLAPQVQLDFNRIAPLYTTYGDGFDARTALADDALDWLGVRHLMSHRTTTLPEGVAGWSLAYEDAAVRIWENAEALPRAGLYATQGGEPEAVELVAGAAAITRITGRELFIDVTSDSPALLVVTTTYDAGWRAYARPQGAGDAAEVEVATQATRGVWIGVPLEAGAWTIRLVYSPASFQVGLFGSLISAGVLLLLVGVWIWRAVVGTNSAESSATARVARNSAAPIILNLFNRGIDFAFAIVMLRILSPEAVGVYYYAVVVFVWFDIFTNFGLDLYLIRALARDKAQSGHLFYNTTVLRMLLAVIGIPLVIGFFALRQATVEPAFSSEGLIALGLLYLGLFPASLSKGMTSLFYANEQAEQPAAIATITTINKAVFGVIALLLGYGIVGLAGVSILNNAITLAVLVWAGRRLIGPLGRLVPDLRLMRGMVRASWPLMLNHFLATIFFQVDIIILEAMKGARVVAQYSVAYRWLLAINIVPAFFTQALFPVMSRQAHEDREALRQTVRFGIKLLVAVAVPLAVAFTALAELLTALLGGQQYLPDGAIALQFMIWSIPFGWMNSLTQYVLVALDRQRLVMWAFGAAVLFNIAANIAFIPLYGFRAAAVVTIFSEVALLLPFMWLASRDLGHVGWLSAVWRPWAAGAAMAAVTLLLAGALPLVIAVAGGGLVYVALLVALRPLDAPESARLRAMLPAGIREARVTRVLLGVPGV
jgi:O-antigen/teichoic acid export membrane protein